MADKENLYVRDILGRAVKTDDVQHAEQLVQAGATPLSQAQAEREADLQRNLSYVDENWGTAGKLGMGAFSGLTLGLGPGALAGMGVVDPKHLEAAQQSGWYTVGDVAGTMLPAIASGGESLVGRGLTLTPAGLLNVAGNATERLAGSFLGGSAGVMGRLASTPLKMAARGASEGALISMGHTVGDSMLHNKPLSAEAMAASFEDGALFGGLIGGSLGTVGAIGEMAIDASKGLAKKVAGGAGGRSYGVVAKSIGMSGEDLQAAASRTGGTKSYLSEANEVLESGGGGIGKTTKVNRAAATEAKGIANGARNEALEAFDSQAVSHSPSLERVFARLDAEVASPSVGTLNEARNLKIVEDIKAELQQMAPLQRIEPVKVEAPKPMSQKDYEASQMGPSHLRTSYEKYKADLASQGYEIMGMDVPSGKNPTWKQWSASRDQLETRLRDVLGKQFDPNPLRETAQQLRAEVMNVIDSEIRTAMETASKEVVGLEGMAEKYAASTQKLRMAEKLEETLGKKAANELLQAEATITPRDVGTVAGMAAIGHPLAGITWLSTRGIGRILQRRLEPAIAKYAFDSAIGISAQKATMETQTKVSSSIRNFFKNASKTPDKAAKVYNASKGKDYDRKAYENAVTRTEQLISANHQDRVRRYAESVHELGYQELAAAMMGVNNRAVQYLIWNMPSRAGTRALGTIRQMPVSKVPTLEEYKFQRIDKAVKNPMSILDDLEKGTLSRDAVQAVKYVYPELHSQIVQSAAEQVFQMKSEGKTMPMNKITMLGVVLDAPIDRVLESDYVGAVQASMAPMPQPEAPPGPQPGVPLVNPVDVMTPLQQTLNR